MSHQPRGDGTQTAVAIQEALARAHAAASKQEKVNNARTAAAEEFRSGYRRP